ncbi:MAG TPA: hypothetical protein VJQ81_07530, partial [Reyranella sp.]|nr:hypothetical protein [Reyranella sp.]
MIRHTSMDSLKEACLSSASHLALALLIGAGALATASQANAANFNVATDAQLRSAISSAQNGDTITFTGNVTLGSNLPTLQRNVTIDGGNFTLSGGGKYRGLFVQSGTVAVNNLTIANATAQGGNGGNANGGGGGGGGAGLGGALFVAAGATVTASNVNLQNSQARGGNGGAQTAGCNFFSCPSGGGGGYWPTGADGGSAGIGNGGGGTGGGGDGAYFNPV